MRSRLPSFSPVVLLITLAALDARVAAVESIEVRDLDSRFRILGRMHRPLGTVLTVSGVVTRSPWKGDAGMPALRVQRINGEATHEDILLIMRPYFHDWGKDVPAEEALPKLVHGRSYEIEGYETGAYVGVPDEAWRRAGINFATAGHHFRLTFVAYRATACEPVRFHPRDFAGQAGLLAGEARDAEGQAVIIGDGWSIVADAHAVWLADIRGKAVEAMGTFAPLADGRYAIASGRWRLARLEDQVGHRVELRGQAWSRNGHWWFRYRGVDIHVARMDELPGWKQELHGAPVVVAGMLSRRMLPRIGSHDERDPPVEQFIVDQGSLQPLPSLLAPELGHDGP